MLYYQKIFAICIKLHHNIYILAIVKYNTNKTMNIEIYKYFNTNNNI